ncbi:MAG: MerR family transcriptional regulator [Armatimonadetes bacterium]|nr:MerR family transcriptional regulator [Armatimonadota bacterium]
MAQHVQEGLYHISIASRLVDSHPQTLRMYERMGLIEPQRTKRNVRLYSDEDIERVRRIQHLTQDLGVNLAGVEVVFKLLSDMHRMQDEMAQEMDKMRLEMEKEMQEEVDRIRRVRGSRGYS